MKLHIMGAIFQNIFTLFISITDANSKLLHRVLTLHKPRLYCSKKSHIMDFFSQNILSLSPKNIDEASKLLDIFLIVDKLKPYCLVKR